MSSLLGLSRAEQEVAKRFFAVSRIAHVVTLGLALATQFAEDDAAYFLAVAALLSEASAWAFRLIGDRRHSLAEEARRRALLADALDKPSEGLALRDLGTRFSKRGRRLAPTLDDPHYYATTEPAGLARLGAAMQESAFWSRCLYGAAATAAFTLAATLFLAVVVALLVVAGSSDGVGLTLARVGVVFLSFLVFSDVLTQGVAWQGAAAKSHQVYLLLAGRLEDTASAMAIFSDYSVATATTPPIPTWFYNRRRAGIEEAWRAALPSARKAAG